MPDNAAGVRPKLRDKVVGQYFAILKDTAAALSAELEVLHSATSREDYRARATVKYGELVQDVAARSKSQSAAGSAPQGDRATQNAGSAPQGDRTTQNHPARGLLLVDMPPPLPEGWVMGKTITGEECFLNTGASNTTSRQPSASCTEASSWLHRHRLRWLLPPRLRHRSVWGVPPPPTLYPFLAVCSRALAVSH